LLSIASPRPGAASIVFAQGNFGNRRSDIEPECISVTARILNQRLHAVSGADSSGSVSPSLRLPGSFSGA
jgi:hypothetical protein